MQLAQRLALRRVRPIRQRATHPLGGFGNPDGGSLGLPSGPLLVAASCWTGTHALKVEHAAGFRELFALGTFLDECTVLPAIAPRSLDAFLSRRLSSVGAPIGTAIDGALRRTAAGLEAT